MGHRVSQLLRFARRERFGVMLAGLTVLLLMTPFAVVETFWSARVDEVLILIALIVMLVSAGFAVSTSRLQSTIVVMLTVPAIVLSIVDVPLPDVDLGLARTAVSGVLIGYIISLIMRHLFRTKEVTFDTIAASLCAYLLLGVLWAMLYTLQDVLQPGSFSYANLDEAEGGMRFGGNRSIYAIYYSFVTLTTLGYGEITPANSSARMLAVVQAIVGQIYLTVLVARLVGLHIAQAMERDRAGDGGSG